MDTLIELVKANAGDRSWSANPNTSITITQSRFLCVVQSATVHAQIKELLDRFREMVGSN